MPALRSESQFKSRGESSHRSTNDGVCRNNADCCCKYTFTPPKNSRFRLTFSSSVRNGVYVGTSRYFFTQRRQCPSQPVVVQTRTAIPRSRPSRQIDNPHRTRDLRRQTRGVPRSNSLADAGAASPIDDFNRNPSASAPRSSKRIHRRHNLQQFYRRPTVAVNDRRPAIRDFVGRHPQPATQIVPWLDPP